MCAWSSCLSQWRRQAELHHPFKSSGSRRLGRGGLGFFFENKGSAMSHDSRHHIWSYVSSPIHACIKTFAGLVPLNSKFKGVVFKLRGFFPNIGGTPLWLPIERPCHLANLLTKEPRPFNKPLPWDQRWGGCSARQKPRSNVFLQANISIYWIEWYLVFIE